MTQTTSKSNNQHLLKARHSAKCFTHIVSSKPYNTTLLEWYTCLFVCFLVRGPLPVVASPVAEHRLQMCRLSGHGSRAQLLRGMWDLPGPGHEPVSSASAGGLLTTVPPGKP